MGWAGLCNGELLRAADAAFDALITTDQNLPQQQNLSRLRLAILVLPTTSWPRIQRHAGIVVNAVNTLRAGQLMELALPD